MAEIISFKDPTDGIERVFSFNFEKPQDQDYVYYSVKSVRPNSDFPERENQWYFSRENLIAALSQEPPRNRSSALFSEIVSTSTGVEQKYKTSFVREFLNSGAEIAPSGPERDPRATPPVRYFETPMGIEVYKEFTFRFPKTRKFSISPPAIQFETARPQEASILDYIVSDILPSELLELTSPNPSDAEMALFTTFSSSQRGGDIEVWLPAIFTQPLGRRQESEELEEYYAGQSTEPPVEDTQDEQPQKRKLEKGLTLNEQAILLFRIGEIMSVNKERRRKSKLYDRFVCLDYKKNGKADPGNVSNHITSTTELSDIFEKLKPIHLAAMIPRVRLFKQYLPEDKEHKKDGSPRQIVEYEFEEFPDASILNSSLGTSTGVGLNSFSWDFNGENQFASEKQVVAKMQLRAQSIDMLDALRRSSSAVGKDGEPVLYRFADVFYPPTVRKQDRESKQVQVAKSSRRKYEAKVIVEYGVDTNSDVWVNDEALRRAIQSIRLELNLTLSKHDLDPQPDGSILLNLDFVGRIDASSKDPFYANILPKSSAIKRLADATALVSTRHVQLQNAAQYENKIEAAEAELAPLEKSIMESAKGEAKAPSDEDFNRAAHLRSEIGKMSEQLQQLNKTFKPSMSEKEYLELISREYDKIKLYQNILNGLFSRDAIDVLKINPNNILSEEETMIIQDEGTVSTGASGENPTTKDVVSANLSKNQFDDQKDAFINKIKTTVFPLYNSEGYYIKYFYFGDLLSVVLDNMLGAGHDTDLRTLLGPIEIVKNMISSDTFASQLSFGTDGKIKLVDSYGTEDTQIQTQFLEEQRQQAEHRARAQRSGDVKKIKQAEEDMQVSSVLVNLADVPISLNLFLQWFADKVTNQGVYSYSLKNFIADSVNSLIVSALQADSTKLILPKQKRKLVITSFEAPADPAVPDVFGFYRHNWAGLVTDNETSAMYVEDFLTTKSKKRALPLFISQNRPKNTDHYSADYILVYAENLDYFRKFRTETDYQRDLKEGIYHLHSGRDAGVVKEIKLTVESLPGYEEMKMMEALKGTEPSVKRIYRASVVMSGVPVFRPGHKVFVKAAAYGSDELLREFGLMGYYSVVTTSSSISAGQYETTLELVYQGSG